MFLRHQPRRTAGILLAAVVGAGTLTAAAPAQATTGAQTGTSITAATQRSTAQRLEQCLWLQTKRVNAAGWAVQVPSVWEDVTTTCNLKYGDLPHRYPQYPFGDPVAAIKGLQRNLNYCYGAGLVVDGKYGSRTRAAVMNVQRRHRVTVDGIYGPQTRSAMNWRLYHPAKRIWSSGCYSPL